MDVTVTATRAETGRKWISRLLLFFLEPSSRYAFRVSFCEIGQLEASVRCPGRKAAMVWGSSAELIHS